MQVAFYLAGEITQVLDSIPWVRCASGNVFGKFHKAMIVFYVNLFGIQYVNIIYHFIFHFKMLQLGNQERSDFKAMVDTAQKCKNFHFQ